MERVPLTVEDLRQVSFLPALGEAAASGGSSLREHVIADVDAGVRERMVPSAAGGFAQRCNHGGCAEEMWTCCVLCDRYGIESPLCHLHYEISACHEHRSQHLAYLPCPCQDCQRREAMQNPDKHTATRLMQRALWIPGLLHILHLVSEELLGSMKLLPQQLGQVYQVAGICAAPTQRQCELPAVKEEWCAAVQATQKLSASSFGAQPLSCISLPSTPSTSNATAPRHQEEYQEWSRGCACTWFCHQERAQHKWLAMQVSGSVCLV